MLVVVVMVMLVVVVVTAALAVLVVIVMVMVMLMLMMRMRQSFQLCLQGILALHGFKQLRCAELIPIGGDNGGGGIVLTQHCHAIGYLFLACRSGVRQHNAACIGNLIVEKLTEVLHIHLALARIHDRGECVELCALDLQVLHRSDHVRELTNARGLDQDAIGRILLQHLRQCLAEIAHQRAADAAGIHFVDLNTCLCQKATVNADLAKFVFNKHKLFARICLFNHLFDQRGLACAQKSGKNINFGHVFILNPFS